MQICRWSRSCPPGARTSPPPCLHHHGSLHFPAWYVQALPAPPAQESLSTISGNQERPPAPCCKPRGCDLASCSLQDLRQAPPQCCFRLQQQAGDRNHHEPISHFETGPKVPDTIVAQAFVLCFSFAVFCFVYPGAENKHLDRNFISADGMYIGLSFPCGKALALLWQSSLWKATFVLAVLHSRRTYFGAIEAFSCILKHFLFFHLDSNHQNPNIMYPKLN